MALDLGIVLLALVYPGFLLSDFEFHPLRLELVLSDGFFKFALSHANEVLGLGLLLGHLLDATLARLRP